MRRRSWEPAGSPNGARSAPSTRTPSAPPSCPAPSPASAATASCSPFWVPAVSPSTKAPIPSWTSAGFCAPPAAADAASTPPDRAASIAVDDAEDLEDLRLGLGRLRQVDAHALGHGG